MSSSIECSELATSRRFSGKSNFSLTCSRLSQYLKENGSFGDLSLGMPCKPEVNGTYGISRKPTKTMSLFPCEASNMNSIDATEDVKPKNLFPGQSSFSSSSSSLHKDVLKMTQTTTRSVKPEPQTAPLTIFYAGQVIVFNDFSADKAKEVMNMASEGATNSFTSNVNNNNIQSVYTPNLAKNQTETETNNGLIPNQVSYLMKTATQELPIARRASLHRFLAKRKDRVTSNAPYQLSDPAKASSKPQTGDRTSWLGFSS